MMHIFSNLLVRLKPRLLPGAGPANILASFVSEGLLSEGRKLFRFLLYLLILFAVSAALSDYGNIDLLSFWQGGHGVMLILSLFPTALLIHSFCLMRAWATPLLAGWLVFIAAQVHVLKVMNFRISFGIISNIFETDSKEASAFITPGVLWSVAGVIVASFLFLWFMGRLKRGNKYKSRLLWLALALASAANFLFVPDRSGMRETALWPLCNIGEMARLTGTYWFQERPLMQSLRDLPSPAAPDSSHDSFPEGITVFFHLGETARADHWTLNGYERNTTPFAQSAQKAGRLIYYPRTLSFAAGTRLGVVGLLTPATLEKPFPALGPFFDLYQKHGFDLKAFRSNQKADDQIYDSTLITLTRIFRDKTDYNAGTSDKIVPAIRDYLQTPGKPNRLIFYYGEGSHAPYYYAPQYARFLPDDMDTLHYGNTPAQMINRYDNSLYATDQFIARVTDLLKDKCAVYIYTADHGEYLGEHGRYSHGINTMCDPEIRWVPFFVWMSPAFEKVRPDLAEALRENAKRLPVVSHDYVFHTTLGVSGFHSRVIQPGLDLSSPEAKPHTGKLPEDISPDYVFDSLRKAP